MKNSFFVFALIFSIFIGCKDEIKISNSIKTISSKTSLTKSELELQKIYKKLKLARTENDSINWEEIEIQNKAFEDNILKTVATNPESITFPFDSLKKENIDIKSSEDKLLRIYSWDTWKGGTMHDFVNLFQYKSNNKIYSRIVKDTVTNGEGDYIPFYSEIFTLKTSNQTYYLSIYNGIYSSKDASQSIKIFTIKGNKLNEDSNLIKTKEGFVNSIDVYFDFFSVVERPERPLKLIKYDTNKKIIYIPIVLENGKVTNGFILYKFNGEFFEFLKIEK